MWSGDGCITVANIEAVLFKGLPWPWVMLLFRSVVTFAGIGLEYQPGEVWLIQEY